MQYKIARPSRFSDRFNRWAIHRGFPALAWLAPRAPRWFLFAGARAIIGVVMTLHGKPRRAIAANLARVLGEDPRSRRVRRATWQMIFHLAYYWADLFRFAQLPAAAMTRLLARDEGSERLFAARHQGRPVILLTAHLGNWELGGVILRNQRLPVSVVYVPDEFDDAERFRSLLRGSVEEIPIRPQETFASLPVLRALKEGRIVAMQGDRDFNDRGWPVDFFGAPAKFPPGPFHLARMTGAVVLPTFVAYAPDHRFEIEVDAPIEVDPQGDRDEAVRRALTEWVRVLESAVRRWPTQWYTFYDFWAPSAPRAATDAPALAATPQ
jgi:KDO2-lipid IV(A) lauroyltransferase